MIESALKHVVDKLVAMAQQNSYQGLVSYMLKSLDESFSPHAIRYFQYFSGSSSKPSIQILVDPLDLSQKEMPVESFEGVRACISESGLITIASPKYDASHRLVFPHLVEEQLTGFLLIEVPELDPQMETIVPLFLDMLINVKTILDSRDQDPMTNLLNRRSFDETIGNVLAAFVRRPQINRNPGRGACLAVLDIDHFKRVNDTYGHAIGDETLITFAHIMRKVFRREDKLFRFGGEEFIVVLGLIDFEQATKTLQRFREEVAKHIFPQVGHITVSIGFVMITLDDPAPVLIEKADMALYHSKENGRNQVNAYESLMEAGQIEGITDRSSHDVELW